MTLDEAIKLVDENPGTYAIGMIDNRLVVIKNKEDKQFDGQKYFYSDNCFREIDREKSLHEKY